MSSRDYVYFDIKFQGYCYVINSTEPEYRLCWGLNRELQLQLKRCEDDFLVIDPRFDQHEFPCFEQKDEHFFWRLLKNRDLDRTILKEYANFEYVLILDAEVSEESAKRLLQALRQSQFLQNVYIIDPETIQNKAILIQ